LEDEIRLYDLALDRGNGAVGSTEFLRKQKRTYGLSP
jgi:hypothetical protein